MKIYALYFSPTGGTKRVLDILISAWDCEKKYIPKLRKIQGRGIKAMLVTTYGNVQFILFLVRIIKYVIQENAFHVYNVYLYVQRKFDELIL